MDRDSAARSLPSPCRAHSLADLLLTRGDLKGARTTLETAGELALGEQRTMLVQRLRTLALRQGDQVGLRRWRDTASAG